MATVAAASPGKHAPTRTELLGKFWFSGQLAQAGVEIATPARDIGTDLIALDPDLTWTVPIQLKVMNTGGLRVEAKYLGKLLALVYVRLGSREGGPADRTTTTPYLLTPEQAWALPAELGRKFSAEDNAFYNFGTVTRPLLERLADFEVSPADWASRLRAAAAALRERSPD